MRKRLLLLVLGLLVFGVGAIAWTFAGLPPVKYHLRCGLNPSCAPTGETLDVEGVTFVESCSGVSRCGSICLAVGTTPPDYRISAPVESGLDLSPAGHHEFE